MIHLMICRICAGAANKKTNTSRNENNSDCESKHESDDSGNLKKMDFNSEHEDDHDYLSHLLQHDDIYKSRILSGLEW